MTRMQIAFAILFAIVVANSAEAQYGTARPNRAFANPRAGYNSRPTFGPYLNLLRQGNPALNYYGLVRPEQEFRAANDQFRNQFGDVRQRFDELDQKDAASNLGVTGHRVRFLADQTGGTGSVNQSLSERMQRRDKLPPTPGSRIAPTGHGAYFSNHGSYYSFPNR